MAQNVDVAGVILAGGPGKRMGRAVKGALEIGGRTIMDRLLGVYGPLFQEIVLSVRCEDDFAGLGLPRAVDKVEVRSSLTGIHAGLAAVSAGHAFVAACDAPFLQAEVVRALLREVREDTDVVIPVKEDGRMEPLCAIYSTRCLPHIHKQLLGGDCKIIRFFDKVQVHAVPVARLRKVDADMVSFMNVNTPADLEEARRMARRSGL